MSRHLYFQSTYEDLKTKDLKKSIYISSGIFLTLLFSFFIIKYQLPKAVATAIKEKEVEAQFIDLQQLLVSDGGAEKGGGTPSNDERSEKMDQSEQMITYKGHEPLTSGKSTHATGENPNNPASSPHKSSNPFGDGGIGGGKGGGEGAFEGSKNGKGGEGDGEGEGYGDGKDRIRLNDPILPKYNTDIDLKIHLKLTINGNGDVTNAVCIKSKTTTSDQTIINDVVREAIKQIRYKKDSEGRSAFCYVTVKVNAG